MQEMADLEEGGEGAALMSAEGFKAYADDCIWVSEALAGHTTACAPNCAGELCVKHLSSELRLDTSVHTNPG